MKRGRRRTNEGRFGDNKQPDPALLDQSTLDAFCYAPALTCSTKYYNVEPTSNLSPNRNFGTAGITLFIDEFVAQCRPERKNLTMATDEKHLDAEIIKYALTHQGATRAEIANATHSSESTIQRKLAGWGESAALTSQYVLGPENGVFTARALIGVKLMTSWPENNLNIRNQRDMLCFIKWGLAEHKHSGFPTIMENVIVERVELLFGGPYELIIIVSALNNNALAAFVSDIVRRLPGVSETNTSTIVSYQKSVWRPKQPKGSSLESE
jgi:hypothetical protein